MAKRLSRRKTIRRKTMRRKTLRRKTLRRKSLNGGGLWHANCAKYGNVRGLIHIKSIHLKGNKTFYELKLNFEKMYLGWRYVSFKKEYSISVNYSKFKRIIKDYIKYTKKKSWDNISASEISSLVQDIGLKMIKKMKSGKFMITTRKNCYKRVSALNEAVIVLHRAIGKFCVNKWKEDKLEDENIGDFLDILMTRHLKWTEISE